MRYVKLTVKIAAILALVSFFLPLISVRDELTGFDLMATFGIGTSGSAVYIGRIPGRPNPFLIVSFIAAVAAVVFVSKDSNGDRMLTVSVASLIGLTTLILFRIFVEFWYAPDIDWIDIGTETSERLGFGFGIVCFLVSCAGAAYLYFVRRKANSQQDQQETEAAAEAPAKPLFYVLCPGCGSEVPSTAGSCPQCARQLRKDCPICGSDIPVSAKYCVNCGREVRRGAAER